MRSKILILSILIILATPGIVQNKGYWLPVDGQRRIEFDKIFDARLRVWGLQYDVNAVIDGKFMKDGKWVEFWTKAQRKELKERFGEVSMLYQ